MLESPKRFALEAVPVAAILLFWNLLALMAQVQNVGGPVRDAGLVVAALYVVVRGVALSDRVLPPPTDDVEALLHENARLAVSAGGWFLAAMVVGALEGWVLWFDGPLAAVRDALGGTGLAVVAIYAVAAGYRALGDGSGTDDGASPGSTSMAAGRPTDATDGTSTDD